MTTCDRLSAARLVPIALALFGGLGCTPPNFLRLRSTLVVNARPGEGAEVVTARDGERARGTIGRVAVLAPDECQNFTVAAETGQATEAANVLRQRCAVELATVERTLASAGYSVVSWRQLRDRIDVSRLHGTDGDPQTVPLSVLAAARLLGAQALVDVNSLDQVTRNHASVDARWERGLFVSDSFGRFGEPVALNRFLPTSLAQIEHHAEAAEADVLQRLRRGAGLNLTVVSVDAGQALFFYRRFLVEPYQERQSVQRLLLRTDGVYQPVEPRELPIEERELTAFRPSVSVSLVDRPDSVEQSAHHQLLREVVSDCVAQMVARLGVASPPAPSTVSEPRRPEPREEPPPPAVVAPPPPVESAFAEPRPDDAPPRRNDGRVRRRRGRGD